VTSFQGYHRHTFSHGVVVERLPLGFAAGRWWASFVFAVPGWEGREPPVDWLTMSRSAWVQDPDGRLDCAGGTGGGSEREYEHTWELVDHGASRARVSYVEDGAEVGSELLTLDPTDRTGCFAVRLADGSLVQRLPIGHAHGTWRLNWVRSEVPPAEVERADEGTVMPHERFVRLRSSAGPVGRVDASGSIGGDIQPFGVAVPGRHTHLEVDYLFENELVGTEVLPLPDLQ
jgi:hypothetical protein